MTVGDKVELADVMTRSYENIDELEIRHVELSLHYQEVIRTVWL